LKLSPLVCGAALALPLALSALSARPVSSQTLTAAQAGELSIRAPKTGVEGETLNFEALWTGAEGARWRWRQVRGPKAIFKSDSASVLAFAAPQALEPYELELECTLTLGELTRVARHVVKVDADDDPPQAQTFVEKNAECGATLLLTGQGQNPEILQGITYEWRQVGDGPKVEIEYADRPQAWCLPPEQGEGYTLSFEFAVSDGVTKPTVQRVDVAIECDARFAPLAAGQRIELPRASFIEMPLPRGSWVIRGVVRLEPLADDKPAVALMRLATGPRTAAGVNYERRDGAGLVRRYGIERDGRGQWKEPELSGNADIGAWDLAKPLGLELGWDGKALAVRMGEPGKRAEWQEPPYPVDLNINSRPRSLVIELNGAKLVIDELELIGR